MYIYYNNIQSQFKVKF